jgi:ribose transport system substrate-binding protein
MLASCSSGGGGTAGSASTGSSSSSGPLRVDFANVTEASDLFHSVHTGLTSALAESGSEVSVKWYDNNLDATTMLQNAQLIVQDKPDAIVEFPATATTQSVGRMFNGAKIPCVSLNVATPGCTFMNIDNTLIGSQAAQEIGAEAKKRGWNSSNTTVLVGDAAAAGGSVNSAVWSFYETLAPILGYPRISLTVKTAEIAHNAIQFDSAATTDGAFSAVENVLPNVPKSNHVIVYAVNDDATVGALHALENGGRASQGNALLAGEGGSKQALTELRTDPRWIAEGVVLINFWGAYAVAAAQAILNGAKPTPGETALPQAVLTKEQVGQYFSNGSATPKLLPALVASNRWLAKGGLLQAIGIVKGLK